MKRRAVFIALILMVVMQIPAKAVSERGYMFTPALSFSDTTAYCSIYVPCSNKTDSVSVVLTLWRGQEIIDSWSDASTSNQRYAKISEEATVVKGQSYKLVADVYINGEIAASAPATGTCR